MVSGFFILFKVCGIASISWWWCLLCAGLDIFIVIVKDRCGMYKLELTLLELKNKKQEIENKNKN